MQSKKQFQFTVNKKECVKIREKLGKKIHLTDEVLAIYISFYRQSVIRLKSRYKISKAQETKKSLSMFCGVILT